ncbi:hypothetical protein CAP31_06175 [Sulfuriferula sp. AH1]|nr:hypothetical protein CAP31_06175 [Sulfuriferula sp. AH1]
MNGAYRLITLDARQRHNHAVDIDQRQVCGAISLIRLMKLPIGAVHFPSKNHELSILMRTFPYRGDQSFVLL